MTPECFGRYLLVDRIGAGGMAEVFLAVMPGAEGFKRTFVVKRIQAERAQSPEFVRMFIDEARIGSLLDHPNIVQVYDFGNVDGMYFLAMEYLTGRDVSAIISRLCSLQRACPPAVAAHIAREVALGLGYAHGLAGDDGKNLNIVHRDVSPSNIMCLRSGGVKLLDFGIAKALDAYGAAAEPTAHGVLKGKLAYVAPERIRGQAFDGRVDVFALGVVLWEMLVGRRLFRGKDELESLRFVLDLSVPPPSSLRRGIPEALDAVVLRALERNPDARYPSAQAMADDLERGLRATPGQPKALQTLLADLFEAEMNAGQQAVARVTPQEFEAVHRSGRRGRMIESLLRPRTASRRGLLGPSIGVAAVVLAVATGALLLGHGDKRSRVLVASPTGANERSIFGPLIEQLPPRVPDATYREEASHPIVRPTRARASASPRRIERGLPIDPFARAIASGAGP